MPSELDPELFKITNRFLRMLNLGRLPEGVNEDNYCLVVGSLLDSLEQRQAKNDERPPQNYSPPAENLPAQLSNITLHMSPQFAADLASIQRYLAESSRTRANLANVHTVPIVPTVQPAPQPRGPVELTTDDIADGVDLLMGRKPKNRLSLVGS